MTQCSRLRLGLRFSCLAVRQPVAGRSRRPPLTVRRRQPLKYRRVRTFGNINSKAKQAAKQAKYAAGSTYPLPHLQTVTFPLSRNADSSECIHGKQSQLAKAKVKGRCLQSAPPAEALRADAVCPKRLIARLGVGPHSIPVCAGASVKRSQSQRQGPMTKWRRKIKQHFLLNFSLGLSIAWSI